MTDLHIGELNLTDVLRQHRTRHTKQYQELGRAIDDLERLLASKKGEYDRATQHLRQIDEALSHPDRVRHVSKSGTVRVLQDEVAPLHTAEASAGRITLHEHIDYYKTLIAGFEREKHPSTELIEELMIGGLAIAQTAEDTLTVSKDSYEEIGDLIAEGVEKSKKVLDSSVSSGGIVLETDPRIVFPDGLHGGTRRTAMSDTQVQLERGVVNSTYQANIDRYNELVGEFAMQKYPSRNLIKKLVKARNVIVPAFRPPKATVSA